MSTCWRCALEGGHELRGDVLVAGEDERPRLALDDGVRVGPVVLAERVAGGLDDGPERVEAGLASGVTSKMTRVTPVEQVDRLRSRPASPSANRRTVAGWATDERISATTSTDSPRLDDRRAS